MASASQAPRDVVAGLEAWPLVPDGAHDRFSGYAVLGVRFESGDILALRRFPATSVGPGYTSVWHRSPEGRWTMHQDVEVDAGCAKYFSAAVETTREASIRIAWTGADRFSVLVGGAEPLAWDLRLGASLASRTLSRLAAATPAPLLGPARLARTRLRRRGAARRRHADADRGHAERLPVRRPPGRAVARRGQPCLHRQPGSRRGRVEPGGGAAGGRPHPAARSVCDRADHPAAGRTGGGGVFPRLTFERMRRTEP